MHISAKALALQEGCSVQQVYRNVHELELTGMYPDAVKESGGLKIDPEAYNSFLCRRRRLKVNQKLQNKVKRKDSSATNT